MHLPKFKDEAEFREVWITPFLIKLGYMLVTHSHGQDEQGKDFIFADLDRFEHMRFYALQAKNGDIGASDIELDRLLNQVKRSFRIRVRNRKGMEEQRVSAVYVVASGKISEKAREYISEYCRSEPFGENVYYLDGERLNQINRYTLYRDREEIALKLLGLSNETQSNLRGMQILQNIFRAQENTVIAIRCRCSAIEQFLTQPVSQEILELGIVESAWFTTDELNHNIEAWSNAIVAGRGIGDNFRHNTLQMLEKARAANENLYAKVSESVRNIDKNFMVEIDVLEDTA